MTLSQRAVLAFVRLVCSTFLSWEVKGRDNVPPDGALMVVASHVNLIDPPLLASISPRWINFMAKEELFRNPFMKAMVHWAHGFSAHRRGSVEDKRKTINQAKNILSEGQVLGMFPEGTRNHVGKLLPGKPGAAAFAAQMDVPLLPVGIAGTEKIRGISCLWKRPHVVINMGQPFKLPPIKGRLSRSQARALTDITMKKIAALLPAENRGVYAD